MKKQNTESSVSLEDWATRIRKEGLKATPIRVHLLSILGGVHHQAQSIEDLAAALADQDIHADRVSLYRSLAQMEKAGLVEKRSLASQRMGYELAENSQDCHHHIVCRSCERVDLVPECQQKMLVRLAKQLGYKLLRHQLELEGLCKSCQ